MGTVQNCGECGNMGMARFEDEPFHLEHHGHQVEVPGLSGWRCGACGDVVFDADSAARYAAASDELVLAARRDEAANIRRIRRKLRLSQAEASRLTGGGHNAFSRYERGEATPLAAVLNLLKLLDKHPELLDELQES